MIPFNTDGAVWIFHPDITPTPFRRRTPSLTGWILGKMPREHPPKSGFTR